MAAGLLLACPCTHGAAEPAGAGGPAPSTTPFTTDAPFRAKITVRVAGEPPGERLPCIGAQVGVPLQASREVAEQEVCVFAANRAAGQELEALTGMLNMAPEGGFSWDSWLDGRGAAGDRGSAPPPPGDPAGRAP